MRQGWFVRGDIDGFVGLFIDNLLQLMLIYVLCQAVCGMEAAFVTRTILPGAAISILIGNLFYAWQARRLMQREGRDDVTALPYGINTPSLIAFVVLIMGPVYREFAGDGTDPEQVRAAARLAWQAGLVACLCSGLMETAAAFVGRWLRQVTPRAALLSALAGIAITFIAMGFVFQMFASPAIAVLPMLMILFTYAGRVRLPLGLPGGVIAVGLGVALAWLFRAVGFEFWQSPVEQPPGLAFSPPRPVPGDVLALFTTPYAWRYLAVIAPMGLFNIIGSLQNLESAEAAGDRYETRSSLLVNGLGTVAASCFGSPFPTTIYIGHPGWKAMGARAAYSVFNGIIITILCLVGGVAWVLEVVPLEVTLGILLWIAVVMTAQAFAEVPKRHTLAVALGLVPALAAWALLLIQSSLRVAGMDLRDAVDALALQESLYIKGVAALSQGFLVSSMLLAAILVFVIERRFLVAACWALAAAALSAAGLVHGFEITAAGVENRFFDLQFGPDATNPAGMFAVAYALGAAVLVALHYTARGEQA
jgi:AGZA family xanthine/uracil permease-like MFS transporter